MQEIDKKLTALAFNYEILCQAALLLSAGALLPADAIRLDFRFQRHFPAVKAGRCTAIRLSAKPELSVKLVFVDPPIFSLENDHDIWKKSGTTNAPIT